MSVGQYSVGPVVASGSGTVTSVALAAPNILTVSGSPVTTSGTLTLTLATQAANTLFAGPATGADAAPTFRTLVAADIGNALVIGKVLTGFSSGAGALAATDTILQAFNKLDGNVGTKRANAFTAGDVTKWDGTPPATIQAAIDRIAAVVGNAVPIP